MTIDSQDNVDYRIEHDTMGEVRVPANALYRAQTQRAVENFPISGKTLERTHIEALARIKKAAATANAELGVLDDELARAIEAAADQVASGKYDGDFPIDVFQTGSGTSSNMNTNEVLAELATRALKDSGSDKVVHPNDHVNASQSSNDVFPTSVHVAVTGALINERGELTTQGRAFATMLNTHDDPANSGITPEHDHDHDHGVSVDRRADHLKAMLSEALALPKHGRAPAALIRLS